MATNKNDYIKKSHLKALEKFKEELAAFAKETGEDKPQLYENAYTSFRLYDIKVENGELSFGYDDGRDYEKCVHRDPDTRKYYEDDTIMEYVKFWRACLRRAKRYWTMPVEKLDAIQDGEIEDEEEDE